ncbi:MAG: helix-turn-helix transcriptional regulator [Lentisphaeria bacterium]|nr:helix-turn-helix transcriptional regulator [Lentisphaeria bacterium]
MHPEIIYSGNYTGSRNTPLHRHDGAELVLVTAGRCGNVVPGGSLTAQSGELFVIPPEMPHRQIDFGEVKTTYVVFEPPDGAFDLSFRVADTSRDPFIPAWTGQIDSLYRQKALEECNMLLALLLRRLSRMEHALSGSPPPPEPIGSVLEYLAGHFADPFSVEQLARHNSLSTSYFNALFRKHVHLSPAEYVRKLRLAYARRLLISSRLSIAEVGEQCGYPNTNYFVRLFRQRHGCTPGDYRAGAGAKPDNLTDR